MNYRNKIWPFLGKIVYTKKEVDFMMVVRKLHGEGFSRFY